MASGKMDHISRRMSSDSGHFHQLIAELNEILIDFAQRPILLKLKTTPTVSIYSEVLWSGTKKAPQPTSRKHHSVTQINKQS